jgi:hypothetical protein
LGILKEHAVGYPRASRFSAPIMKRSRRQCGHSAGPAPNPPKAVSTFRARSRDGRHAPESGHPAVTQYRLRWAMRRSQIEDACHGLLSRQRWITARRGKHPRHNGASGLQCRDRIRLYLHLSLLKSILDHQPDSAFEQVAKFQARAAAAEKRRWMAWNFLPFRSVSARARL